MALIQGSEVIRIKNRKIISILLIIMFILTQILLPITTVFNKKVQYLYKYKTIKEVKENWSIKIPIINLSAPIKDGIDTKVLNKYVGHFLESGYILGNVSLAAHNRGYPVNYFQDLKELKIGDEIIYEYKDLKLTYKINKIKIIDDTDVEVVKNTKENKITLITCVENKPEKRRYIQGILTI